MKNNELDAIRETVRRIIGPLIASLGMELDDVELSKMRGRALLRVFIDRQSGVTIDDCERVSREVEAVLDVEDPIPCSYVLEVSSPGLDRPLKGPGDFKRFTGRTARVVTVQPVERESFFIGKIAAAGDDEIELLLPQNRQVTIAYKNISKARLEVEV